MLLWESYHGIDPNTPGHHDCSTKAVFPRTADQLQCWPMLARNGTYWRMLAFSFLHISFIGTIALVVLYGSIKFFRLKIALGLALGESWPLLAQPQKNTDVHKGMLLWESFPKQTCKNYLRRKQFFCASLRRSLSHGNEHHGIDPNMLRSGHHDCSTKAVFLCTADKLQCWPMLARNGTYWRMLAFSFLHISFIGTIALVVLYGSVKIFDLKIALGLALGESWPLLAQPQKNTDVHKGMLLWESFPKQTCKNYLRRKQGSKLMDQIQTVV